MDWEADDYDAGNYSDDDYINDDEESLGGDHDIDGDYEEDEEAPDPILSEAVRENAQIQMADSFERITGNIQTHNADDDAAWQFDFGEDADIDFDEEIRGASGIGRRKTRRPRGLVVLSASVNHKMGQANQAYVNSEYEKAITLYREIIKIEPAAGGAWNALAQCHQELGDLPQALQLEIIAAHLMSPDAEIWRGLGRRSKDMGHVQQAIYCFRKILTIEPKDVDALWDRSYLLREIGDLRNALTGFLNILKILPHFPEVLEQLRGILIELGDIPRAATLFQDAFDYNMIQKPDGPEDPESDFGARHLIALADFYNSSGNHEMAIKTVRTGARWMDGRLKDGRRWDACPDDREFDHEGFSRDDGEGGSSSVIGGVMPQGFYPLDINFRHRLAIARLKSGDLSEAEMHCAIITSNDVREYSVLFTEIADVYFGRRMYKEALDVYSELAQHDETSSIPTLLQIGACHRHMSNFKEAEEVFTLALSADADNTEVKMKLAEIYEITGHTRKALNLVTEVIETRQANPAPSGSSRSRSRKDPDQQSKAGSSAAAGSFFDETRRVHGTTKNTGAKKAKLTVEQVRELEREREKKTIQAKKRLDALEPMMLNGEQEAEKEWILEAGTLVEDFRIVRQLFTADRFATFRGVLDRKQSKKAAKNPEANEEDMASRLEQELAEDAAGSTTKIIRGVTVFRGLTFDEWLLLFIQYAFLLTKTGQYPLANEVLRHVTVSNAYSSQKYQTTLEMAMLACAVHGKDYAAIVEHNRSLSLTHQFNNEPTRLLAAALGTGIHASEAYVDTKYQKSVARLLKVFEWAAAGKPFRWTAYGQRWVPDDGKKDGDSDEEDNRRGKRGGSVDSTDPGGPIVKATKISPVLLAHYGQMCLGARSFQSAIWYLMQAYKAQPLDPLICLGLSVACLGRAMQRQADNRHHLITESMLFLAKYREFRRDTGELNEIEYNFGRAFQQIGINSLAAKHYENVLDIVSKRIVQDSSNIGVAREAAYNLSIIYVTNGSPGLARLLYEKWLSL